MKLIKRIKGKHTIYYMCSIDGGGGSQDWKNKPASWPDIRTGAENKHIYLLVDDRTPIGFTATATGGYSVKIDGVDYADYNSDAQFSISDWSAYSDTDGYTIDYPTGATTAHIIDIYPQSDSSDITAFHCARVAASGREAQGVLWAHFHLSTTINLQYGFARYNQHYNPLLEAITAKNNLIKASRISYLCGMGTDRYTYAANLSYIPVIDLDGNQNLSGEGAFNLLQTATLDEITLKNGKVNIVSLASNASNLKKINTDNANLYVGSSTYSARSFLNAYNLEELPEGVNYTNAVNLYDYITNAEKLKDMTLDVRAATNLTRIGCYGSASHFMSGFKGLRVSSSAPFDNATSPQINVSYTGMNRTALVQLFNDLPTLSSSGYTTYPDTTDDNGILSNINGGTWGEVSVPNITAEVGDVFEFETRAEATSWGYYKNVLFSGAVSLRYLQGKINVSFGNALQDSGGWVYLGYDHTNVWWNIKVVSTVVAKGEWEEYDKINTTISIYDDNDTLIASETFTDNKLGNYFVNGTIYISDETEWQQGYIDIGKTAIKKNNISYFSGNKASGSTISVVGCTGTADLTAADKAIAENKGWSITLS